MVKEAGKINWEVSFRVRSEWGRPKVKQLLDYIMVSVSTGPMQGCEKGVLILYIGIGSVFEEEVNEFFQGDKVIIELSFKVNHPIKELMTCILLRSGRTREIQYLLCRLCGCCIEEQMDRKICYP